MNVNVPNPRPTSFHNEKFDIEVDRVILGDSIEVMKSLPNNSVHLILSDIPYGIGAEDWDVLHENTNAAYMGSSPAQQKAGTVFKRRGKPINGWSDADRLIPKQYYDWCSTWALEWLRVLKPGGSAMVFAGRRFAPRCVVALEDAGFNFRDMISWVRPRATHRAQRLSVVFDKRNDQRNSKAWEGWRVGNLRPNFEPIIWCFKPYKITIADNVLEHGVGAYNQLEYEERLGHFNNAIECGMTPGEGGLHPSQKPAALMETLISLTTKPGQLVLDPFAGSGTTALAARNAGRHYIAIDKELEYVETMKKRLARETQERLLFKHFPE